MIRNLKVNIPNGFDSGYILCEACGKRIEDSGKTKRYCESCAKEIRKEKIRINVQNYRQRCNHS